MERDVVILLKDSTDLLINIFNDLYFTNRDLYYSILASKNCHDVEWSEHTGHVLYWCPNNHKSSSPKNEKLRLFTNMFLIILTTIALASAFVYDFNRYSNLTEEERLVHDLPLMGH